MKNAIVCFALLAGCADSQLDTSAGNAELGIASFAVQDTEYKTTVTGLDASGAVVGKLEIVHGLFTVSPMFADDYDTPQIVGRKLDVDVRGDQMTFETAGYEPLMHLPPHPDYEARLPIFLDDPHVKPVLTRWGFGFEGANRAESAYTTISGTEYGDSPATCNGSTTCGGAYYGTVNTCGGGAAASQASRVEKRAGTNCGVYSSSYNEVMLAQCCPPDYVNTQTQWFARKACPTTSDNGTECGTRVSGACKSCPGYPTYYNNCSIGVGSSVGFCNTSVYPLNWSYTTCHLGGGSCRVNSDCCTAEAMFCDNGACNYL